MDCSQTFRKQPEATSFLDLDDESVATLALPYGVADLAPGAVRPEINWCLEEYKGTRTP